MHGKVFTIHRSILKSKNKSFLVMQIAFLELREKLIEYSYSFNWSLLFGKLYLLHKFLEIFGFKTSKSEGKNVVLKF